MANSNVEVKLTNVRLSFAHIFRAKKNSSDPEATPKFQASFLIDKSTKEGKRNIARMEEAIEEAMRKKWGDNPPRLKADKICLRDGDDEDWNGYEGCMYVSANNVRRPTIVDRDRSPLTEEDGKPYSGCYVNAIVRVWAQDNQHGKRVNASLEGIQFVKDGEPFGPPPLSEDAFDDLGDDEDDEDDRPRKKRRRDDDDDDEDDRPRKKRRRSSADDEDLDDEIPF